MKHDCIEEIKCIIAFSYGAYAATENKAFKIIVDDLRSLLNCITSETLDTELHIPIDTESMEHINASN